MEDAYLIHHGIKGQRWGVRRFQNADGSLTAAGKKHYSSNSSVGAQVPEHLKDVPKTTRRTAQKDAKEFAEAKMFYGEGAGNRRKL